MADFSYICKNLKGTVPAKGQESGTPACSRQLETGAYCTAESQGSADEGKVLCPSADYFKILSMKKRKF